MKIPKKSLLLNLVCLVFTSLNLNAQTELVNTFLGSSGDHGQMSPAASAPFSQLSILPATVPGTHTGYEKLAKDVLGFTHNRFEGVGCQGSGGLLLLKPFLGTNDNGKPLTKIADQAKPGIYSISFANGIAMKAAVIENYGLSEYLFPAGEKGFKLNLEHTFNRAFVAEEHKLEGNTITGWIQAKTTCHAGTYKIYYTLEISDATLTQEDNHIVIAKLPAHVLKSQVRIAFSAVDEQAAKLRLAKSKTTPFPDIAKQSDQSWNQYLGTVKVEGPKDRKALFYSMLYRTLQSPFVISEEDGRFRGNDGQIHRAQGARYHGWAIWDNYKTQLPLLSILYPKLYQNISESVSNLYRYGKYDYAGPFEPANSVRTEHAEVVLLDAVKKGYKLDLATIRDSLLADTSNFDFTKPDKYLEAAYDMWTMSKIFELQKDLKSAGHFAARAKTYAPVWEKQFKDLSKNDVDRMSARGMYQGTIRQYRWAVPFDMKGLVTLAGGKTAFTEQLDDFFDNHYFNRANEPDLQSPTMYYASDKPWKYQSLVRQIALDTVVQYYFNDNSRGIGAHIDRIYKNDPKAFIRTMDDDAGAMSGWFVMTAMGIQQPLVGEPVYYLNVPLFEKITVKTPATSLEITVPDFSDKKQYISKVILNGKDINRLWLTHQELVSGGKLIIESSEKPTRYGKDTVWISGN